MKALMTHSENSGLGYYRIWMPADALKRSGWEINRIPDYLPTIPNDKQSALSSTDPLLKRMYEKYGSWEELAEGIDIMILQRSDQPQVIALTLAIREQYGVPVVYEVDDNIYDVSENSPAYKYWHPGSPFFEVAETFMRNVDAITVSTHELKKVYEKYNDNVYVLENCQDPKDWEGVVRPEPEDKIVIGWAGSYTHYDDLKIVAPAMKKILKKYPNVVFRVLGLKPDFLQNMKGVELRSDWSDIRQWQRKLAELNFDIGIAPVVNRPFNRGKSNIKWQEYSMLGIPTVASDVGPYRSIRDGVDGVLTNNDPKNWYNALERAIKDAELRKTLGENAKQRVLTDFNIDRNIGQWNDAYREIIERFKSVSS